MFESLLNTKEAVQNISQCLFEMEIQTHIIHLQAIKRSFEIHNALGAFYSTLGGINDDLVEKSYPKTGLLLGYKSIDIKNNIDPLMYIRVEMKKIEDNRKRIGEGYIQQMVDNILEEFAHCIYKLENLQ